LQIGALRGGGAARGQCERSGSGERSQAMVTIHFGGTPEKFLKWDRGCLRGLRSLQHFSLSNPVPVFGPSVADLRRSDPAPACVGLVGGR
jgi:hypothetical protein